ncbi:MAG: hypothetical protein Q9208_006395 [Pyrenodesmia sp. 3 TL-2023]
MSSSRAPDEDLKDLPETLPVLQPALPNAGANPLKRALPDAEDRLARKKRAAREHLHSLAGLPMRVIVRRHIDFLSRWEDSAKKPEDDANTRPAQAMPAPSQSLYAPIEEAGSHSTEPPSALVTGARPQSLRTPIDYHQEPAQLISGVLPLHQLPPLRFYL